MSHRLMVGVLASLAAMFMVFGRTQSLSATAFRPAQTPSVDRVAPVDGARTVRIADDVVWPSNAPRRLLEVLYVYTHRTPVARSTSEFARRDSSES